MILANSMDTTQYAVLLATFQIIMLLFRGAIKCNIGKSLVFYNKGPKAVRFYAWRKAPSHHFHQNLLIDFAVHLEGQD